MWPVPAYGHRSGRAPGGRTLLLALGWGQAFTVRGARTVAPAGVGGRAAFGSGCVSSWPQAAREMSSAWPVACVSLSPGRLRLGPPRCVAGLA